ncbi:MAG TPA: hypothetical protein VK983_01915 [Candidatus Limnocylindrales bacterium]|nr:hypothetical protein [Candidatus Limnocylindrales bacterium]
MPRQKQKSPSVFQNRYLWIAAGAVGVVLILSNVLALQQLSRRVDSLEQRDYPALVVAAARDLLKTPVVDAPSERRFLPEARLVLPLDHSLTIVYNGNRETLYVADKQAVDQAARRVQNALGLNAASDAIPALQACSRQVQLSVTPVSNDQVSQAFAKGLSDGRTLYVVTDKGCSADSTELVEYLRAIESY